MENGILKPVEPAPNKQMIDPQKLLSPSQSSQAASSSQTKQPIQPGTAPAFQRPDSFMSQAPTILMQQSVQQWMKSHR